MKLTRLRIAAIGSAVSLLLLVGCSLTGSPGASNNYPAAGQPSQSSRAAIPALRRDFLTQRARAYSSVWQVNPGPGWIEPAATGQHLVYVSDENGQTVYIFPQKGNNQAPIGKITSGVAAPNGLFVDKLGNLFVCNFGGGTVTVYRPGAVTPFRTLKNAGSAIDVVVGVDETTYVSNWDSGSAGTVLEYPKGHSLPAVTIPINGAPEGVALDSSNDLFVAYNDNTAGDGEVLKFLPGSKVGSNLGIHVGYVGGATLDSLGNLLVVDQNVPGVDVFPPGATKPSKVITGFSLAFDIALTQSNQRLWVTDPFTAVNEVSYPGGKLVNTITNTISSAFGVATSPDGSY